MDDLNDLIIDILNSGNATKDGKRLLLKDFSWIATPDYQPIYEKLSQDPELKDAALFALERLND
jgi:hypothetical protein